VRGEASGSAGRRIRLEVGDEFDGGDLMIESFQRVKKCCAL